MALISLKYFLPKHTIAPLYLSIDQCLNVPSLDSFLDRESFQTSASVGDCNISSITGEQSLLEQPSRLDKDKSLITDERNNWSDISSLVDESSSLKDSFYNVWLNQSASLIKRDEYDGASQHLAVQTLEDLSSYFDKVEKKMNYRIPTPLNSFLMVTRCLIFEIPDAFVTT